MFFCCLFGEKTTREKNRRERLAKNRLGFDDPNFAIHRMLFRVWISYHEYHETRRLPSQSNSTCLEIGTHRAYSNDKPINDWAMSVIRNDSNNFIVYKALLGAPIMHTWLAQSEQWRLFDGPASWIIPSDSVAANFLLENCFLLQPAQEILNDKLFFWSRNAIIHTLKFFRLMRLFD